MHTIQKEEDIHELLDNVLPKMGFKDVIITHERGNYPENGKDLICSFHDNIEDKKDWYAFVVKKGIIKGTSVQINEIESQIKDCFKYEYKSLKTTSERVRICKVKVVTNEHFSNGAKDKILSNDGINKPFVDFWDDEKLIQIIDKYDPDFWLYKNILLRKLQHEIPVITNVTKSDIEKIRKCLNEPIINRNKIHVFLDQISVNNFRNSLLFDNFFIEHNLNKPFFAMTRTEVTLHHFLNSYLNVFREKGAYRNVGVYLEMYDENKTIFVSYYYLHAILNIIENAILYASVGTLVYIKVCEDRLIVTDVGIPIKKNEMKHIFEVGFRGDVARTKTGNGLGYGLFLSKKIFEAHHSKIEPESVYLYKENYYLQKAVCEYLSRIPDDKRNHFIHNGLEISEYPMADELYNRIMVNSNNVVLDMQFYHFNMEMMQKWLNYSFKYGFFFFNMEDNSIFNEEIYKVSFTIYFPNT